MKEVAVLLDGSFLLKKLRERLGQYPTPEQVLDFSTVCVLEDEKLLRIYYYDCPPFAGTRINPLSREKIDFQDDPLFDQQTSFQTKLARKDHIAFRRGVLSFKGWKIGKRAWRNLLKKPRAVEFGDLVPDFEQKRVDIKIGLDIAWLASKNIVDRIILVTGDADFIPAMKFARREGVQIVLVTLGNPIRGEMREHVDIFRNIEWPSSQKELFD